MIKFKEWKNYCQACKLCQAVSSHKAKTNALLINSASATTPTTSERASSSARIASAKCPKYQLLCEWESQAMKGPVRWGSLSWNRSTLCVKRKDILAVRSVLIMLFRPLILLFAPLPFSPNETIYTQPVSFSASYPAVVSICICIMFLSAFAIFPLIRVVIFPFLSIGSPVVTLGFGFKSYVGYRMRQRRQKVKTRIDSSGS